jgi:hypothetical protein
MTRRPTRRTSPLPARSRTADRTEDVSRQGQYERGIDYDAEGRILGYEFLNVSRGVDLADLPHQAELAALFARIRGLRVLEAT